MAGQLPSLPLRSEPLTEGDDDADYPDSDFYQVLKESKELLQRQAVRNTTYQRPEPGTSASDLAAPLPIEW